jgi:hypothetical protein
MAKRNTAAKRTAAKGTKRATVKAGTGKARGRGIAPYTADTAPAEAAKRTVLDMPDASDAAKSAHVFETGAHAFCAELMAWANEPIESAEREEAHAAAVELYGRTHGLAEAANERGWEASYITGGADRQVKDGDEVKLERAKLNGRLTRLTESGKVRLTVAVPAHREGMTDAMHAARRFDMATQVVALCVKALGEDAAAESDDEDATAAKSARALYELLGGEKGKAPTAAQVRDDMKASAEAPVIRLHSAVVAAFADWRFPGASTGDMRKLQRVTRPVVVVSKWDAKTGEPIKLGSGKRQTDTVTIKWPATLPDLPAVKGKRLKDGPGKGKALRQFAFEVDENGRRVRLLLTQDYKRETSSYTAGSDRK